jgi:leader peptidase (prepilin peptidase)/N-methyltransferase
LADVGITARPATIGDPALLRRPVRVAIVALIAVALVFIVLPFGATAVVGAFLAAVLVVLSAIDIERGIIPNRIVLPATGLVLLFRLAFFAQHAPEWILGMLIGGVAIFLPRLINSSSLGMGDVKLALLIGAALGWGVVLALPVAFICVFPAALVVLARGGLAARHTTIPFGPFMALGALIVLFFPYVAGLPTN